MYLFYDIFKCHFGIQSVSPVFIGLADICDVFKLMSLSSEFQGFDMIGNC